RNVENLASLLPPDLQLVLLRLQLAGRPRVLLRALGRGSSSSLFHGAPGEVAYSRFLARPKMRRRATFRPPARVPPVGERAVYLRERASASGQNVPADEHDEGRQQGRGGPRGE